MDDLRVIRAVFSSWRPVQGRSVVQLIMEVPIEHTHDVMTRLGVPMPGESKWCAIALLKNGACASGSSDGAPRNAPKPSESFGAGDGQSGITPAPTNAPSAKDGTSQKERKPFNTLPLSQQAAIRCQDADFRTFLARDCVQVRTWDSETAADLVRRACQVQSRSEIKSGGPSGDLWLKLEREYQAWLTDRKYSEARR